MEKRLGIVFFLLVLVLLLQLSELRAAQDPMQMDTEENKNNKWAWAIEANTATELAQELSHLMGEEKCEESDEECVKRRMITESHLDYIYTQSHNNNNKP